MKYFLTSLGLSLWMAVSAQMPLGGCVVTFTIGNQTEVCSSQNVFVLPAGSPTGGVYSGAGVLDNLFFPSIAGPGEHIITYSFDDGFCIGSAQDTIIVVSPEEIVLSGDFEICIGDVTTITASNASEIEWSTNDMGSEIALSPTTTTIYSVSGYDANFCITSADFEIMVHQLPVVFISGNTDVCVGGITELMANGAEDYIWSTLEFSDVIVLEPMENEEICVTGIDVFGCASDDCVDIIMHNDPEITINGDTDVCMGESAVLTAVGGIQYEWSTGSTSSVINVEPLGGDEICLFGEDQFGCTNDKCVVLSLIPIPLLILNGDAAVCENDIAVISAEGAESYVWSTGDENDTTSVQITETTTIQVIGTGSNGCTAEALWTILAYELPTLEVEGNTAGCFGEVITLTASGADSYVWNNEFIGSSFSIEIQEDTTLRVVGVGDGFCSTMIEVELTVLEADQVEISGMEDVCPGEIIVLTASGSEVYVWSNGTMGETAEYSLTENTVVSVTGTGENGCSDIASEMIQVLTGVGVDITGDLIVCPGDTIVATINGLENPVWDNDTIGDITLYALIESGPISVTGINSEGCLMTYSENATINPLPDLAIEGDLMLCTGETTTLQASGAIQYVWSTGAVEEIIELNPSTDIVLTLEGVSNLGCTGTLTVVVEVNEFTPVTFELSEEMICDNAGGLSLSASPTGGVFSGEGVSGSVFTPEVGMNELHDITYSYTNESGCTSQSTQSIFVDNCSGVDEMESFSFVLYPNPAEDRLTITADVQGGYTLMIVNAHGQLVRKLSISSPMSVIDITDLSAGVYELVLMQNGEMMVKRFVKE